MSLGIWDLWGHTISLRNMLQLTWANTSGLCMSGGGKAALEKNLGYPLPPPDCMDPVVHYLQVKVNTWWLRVEMPDTSESFVPDPYGQRCQVAQHLISSVISGNLIPAVGAQHMETCS